MSITTTVKVDPKDRTFGAPARVVGETGPYAFVSGTTAYYDGATREQAGSSHRRGPDGRRPRLGRGTGPKRAGPPYGRRNGHNPPPYGATYTCSSVGAGAGTQTVTATNGSGSARAPRPSRSCAT